MANTATTIVLTAGTITFANEWYVTHEVNWRVPVATLLAGAIFEGIGRIDERAGIGLAVMVLIGAVTTRFHGQSAADTIVTWFGPQPHPHTKHQAPRIT
jgi:hypothetical protein